MIHEPQEYCPMCQGEDMEITPEGDGIFSWYVYLCQNPDCEYGWSEEPDWDSMRGGPDYE